MEKQQKELAALAAEHGLLRTLIDNLPDCIYVKDIEARKVVVNRADLENLGCQSEAEALGKTDFDFFPQEMAAGFFADDQSVLQTGQPVINREEKVVLPNGETRWLLTTKVPWRDASGKIIGLIGIGRNVTSQRLAEIKLNEERNLLRTLVDSLPDIIFAKSAQSRFILTNTACARQLGAGHVEEVLGKTDADFVSPELGAQYLADEQALMRSGQPVTKEELTQHKETGKTRWSLTTKVPLKDDAGKVVGLIGIARDITEQKQAGEVLRRSREEFKDLFDNAPVGFHEVDAEGRLIRINNTELQMLGYSAGELLGQFIWKISGEAETTRQTVLAKLAGKMAPLQDFERMFRRKDGSTFPVLINDRLLKREDGTVVGLRAAVQDITEQKQAEETLARERQLLRTLIDNLPDGIYAKDTEARKILANPADLKNLGCKTEAEAVGKTDFDLFPKEIADAFFADDQSVLKDGKPVINREEKAILKGGETRWLLTSKIPWRDASGKIIGLVGIGRDITDRKNLEEQIVSARRMESLGRLATGVAHDLNNILAPILISIELLQKKLQDEEYLKMLSKAEASAHRGADIIKQMLWFGRGLAGQRLPVDLHQLAAGVAQFTSETFDKNIKVEKQIAPDLWTTIGDSAQLHQVLMNLCLNARDAMPSGGTLTIAARNVTVNGKPFAVVEIKDTGCGIAPGLLDKIYEPFFTTKEVGHGLGLSTAQSIVKSHGGFIRTESQPGQGSTFRVHLPAQV
jgi:PAS domain S-box-containing protein